MRRIALSLTLIGTTGSVACADNLVTAPGITAVQLCARQDSLIATQSPFPNLNELFDTMARLLPGGFAGLASDGWFLQTPALADTARTTAGILAACPGAQATNLWAIVQTEPAHRVSYSWLQLRDWYQQLLRPGVSGLATAGIDVAQNRVSLTVQSQNDVDMFRARARDLKIPEDALALRLWTAAGAASP